MFNIFRKKNASASNPQKNQRNPSPSSGIKQSLLSLEQRLMFDAAAAATASEVASEQVAQEQAEVAVSGETSHNSTDGETGGGEDVVQALTTYMPAERSVEVAFVDPTVPNYQEVLAGMDPNIEVIMLDGGQDGVEQMAEALSGRSGIDAIHLISHGSSGELQLGTGTLNAESMSTEYADEFSTIRGALSEHADLLVYGCSFGEGVEGSDAVNLLAELTGADVAASSDATGHIDLGGDWEFEVQAGSIETDLALTDTTQMNWAGILGTETVKDTFSSTSYNNNNGTQSWSSSWSETDAGGSGASGGDVRVNSGQLRIDTDSLGNAASRGVNLSGATSATLTFTYSNTLTGADRIEARISTDNGATYVTLAGGVFSNALNTGSGSASIDISGYASATTRIQFIVTGSGGGDRLYVDNVQVSYDVATNAAPTISNVGGDSLSYTEGAGAIVIDQGANALVADSDSVNFDTGALTVSIPVGCHPTEDVLSIRNQGVGAGQIGLSGNTVTYGGVAIGTCSGGAGGNNLVISFNSNATSTAVTALVKNITYEDIDTDSPAEGSLTIRFALTDGDGGTSANYDVSAYVSGVNDAPTDLSLSTNAVAENASNGTVVGTVTGTDPDASDTKTYSLTDTAGGRFAINSSTGQITVANGSLLNYENATSHTVTVRVTDSGGLTYAETFTINLTDVNEAVPVITSNGGGATTSVTVSENTTVVTTVTATDADTRQTLTYSIVGGADSAQFTINSATGALSFVSAPNYEAPTDSGGNNIYDVTVQVSDGKWGTATQAIAVTVTNVNEGPSDLSLSTNTVAENAATGTVVGTVTGTDVDAGDTKTYSLTDTAGGRFAIDSTTGQLTVANGSLLNYESATSHTVTVRVTDSGGQSYTETFTINLSNVNEGPTDLSLSANTVTENATTGTVVGTVSGTDPDSGDTKTYSLTDTADGRFAIDSSTGQLTVANGSLLNYESAASHTVTVRVTDSGGQSHNETFTINLTNVNEAPTDLTLSANIVPESATTGTVVGIVTGTDVDAGDTKTYSLTNTAGGRFAINASTGEITVADGSLLNYENAASHSLTVQVTDSGGQSYSELFTIYLTNVNEWPTDLALSADTVAENATTGTVVGTISGTDPDASDTKTYSLTDTAGGRFAIDSATGQLTVADGSLLNYESASSHTITVRVTDSGGQSYNETFTINLTNVNEGPTGADATITITEDTPQVLTAANFGFSDIDAGDSLSVVRIDTLPTAGTLTLSGVAVTAGQVVSVADITAGRLVFAPTADANGTGYASVTFSVRDSNNAYDRAPNTLTFNVTATNDAPTDLSLSANSVAENATTGTVVGTVSGTDVDVGDTKSYSLTDTAGGRFAIDSATGQLTVADGSLLNYESAPSHTVTVRVTDSGGQSYTETFTINLTNFTEAPTGADATDAPTEDTANILTQVNFGMRETNRIPNAPSSGHSLLIEGEEEGFRLPDGLQKTIEIKAEAPLTADILTSGRNGPSAVSEQLSENVIATRGTPQLAHPNENHGSDALRDSMVAQGAAVVDANHKDFPEPDDPIENGDESVALKMSAAVGLAGVVLQNSLGNNTKVSRLISRPAGASNVHPNTTPQNSADDNRASDQDRSEHPQPAVEDADQAGP